MGTTRIMRARIRRAVTPLVVLAGRAQGMSDVGAGETDDQPEEGNL